MIKRDQERVELLQRAIEQLRQLAEDKEKLQVENEAMRLLIQDVRDLLQYGTVGNRLAAIQVIDDFLVDFET